MSGDYPCHLVDMMSFVDLTDLGYTQEHADELGDFLFVFPLYSNLHFY